MAEKVYPHPSGTVINAIHDIVELQKGKATFSDTSNGKIFFCVTLYAYKYEFQFTVTSIDKYNSQVNIEVAGTELGRNDTLRRQIFLLEAMLNDVRIPNFSNNADAPS